MICFCASQMRFDVGTPDLARAKGRRKFRKAKVKAKEVRQAPIQRKVHAETTLSDSCLYARGTVIRAGNLFQPSRKRPLCC